MNIKKGDKVIIITGKDKGKSGTVTKAMPKEDKIIVGGVNVLKKHRKARKSGEKGQILEIAAPIHVSNARKTEESKPEKVKKEKKTSTKE